MQGLSRDREGAGGLHPVNIRNAGDGRARNGTYGRISDGRARDGTLGRISDGRPSCGTLCRISDGHLE